MPALFAGCARVKVQALEGFIVHDLQDMRMPADEDPAVVADDLIP